MYMNGWNRGGTGGGRVGAVLELRGGGIEKRVLSGDARVQWKVVMLSIHMGVKGVCLLVLKISNDIDFGGHI